MGPILVSCEKRWLWIKCARSHSRFPELFSGSTPRTSSTPCDPWVDVPRLFYKFLNPPLLLSGLLKNGSIAYDDIAAPEGYFQSSPHFIVSSPLLNVKEPMHKNYITDVSIPSVITRSNAFHIICVVFMWPLDGAVAQADSVLPRPAPRTLPTALHGPERLHILQTALSMIDRNSPAVSPHGDKLCNNGRCLVCIFICASCSEQTDSLYIWQSWSMLVQFTVVLKP